MRQLSGARIRWLRSMSSPNRTRILVALLVACWWSQAVLTCAQVQDRPDGLDIDCGSSYTYTDPVIGIQWLSDVPFISSGESHTNLMISGSAVSDYSELKSVRSFPDLQFPKNCYSLPVVKNETYLIRATFAYENFDNRLKPPTFRLALEGTIVADITTTATGLVYKELVYISQSNVTFLCLVQDGSNSTPFISAISLKLVTNAQITPTANIRKYLEEGKFMTTETRINFGGKVLIRSPFDAYDRYWHPEGSTSIYLRSTAEIVQSLETAVAINGSRNSLEPPSAVLQTAVTTNDSLTFYVLPPDSRTYISTILLLHFAELEEILILIQRSFEIVVEPYSSPNDSIGIITLEKPYQVFGWSLVDKMIGPSTQFALNSNLPPLFRIAGPILNALELYSVSTVRLQRTVERDVLAIGSIKAAMNLTKWTGDPCLPTPYLWVKCSQGDQAIAGPEITGINLTGYNLRGFISPSFADLLALTTLSLSDNSLSGSFPYLLPLKNLKILRLESNNLSGVLPEWLSFSQLVELSVQNNNFSGRIPSKLLSSTSLRFSFCPGNQFLNISCGTMGVTSDNSNPAKSNGSAIIGGCVGGVLVVVLIIAGVWFGYCRCHRDAIQETAPIAIFAHPPPENDIDTGSVKPFTLEALTAATNKFVRKLGEGGFGAVYYGKLLDGREVAVKVAKSKSQGDNEFFNEVEILSRVRHRNLVELIGYCHLKKKQILVYEYIQNGSLYEQLHGTPANIIHLDWRMRLKIAVSTAEGLNYLHNDCIPSFIHRDVKSSNILLTGPDQLEVAKVADFGLSRRGPLEDAAHVSTIVRGTPGYLDPEYHQTQKLTLKSDVYSFGVVLLELLTGRKPVCSKPANRSEWNLRVWVQTTMEAGTDVNEILDTAVRVSNPNPRSLMKFIEIALRSVEPKSVDRPTMAEVVRELHTIIMLEGSQTEHSSRDRREFPRNQCHLGPADESLNAFSEMVISPR